MVMSLRRFCVFVIARLCVSYFGPNPYINILNGTPPIWSIEKKPITIRLTVCLGYPLQFDYNRNTNKFKVLRLNLYPSPAETFS